ncbi:type I-E CRISPR-associated protein Cas7/Cse4/CasC [Streptomyces sp. NPDC051662]|uniref:type I-E CRISPR-associated protein Cas7/Cse4/CasC n=1 Tax=Streptomyces sp. NPDC051662 TaxID=3154750 RepID=UPI00341292AC
MRKLRSRRPISFVAAFEKPVTVGEEGGFLQQSCERLATYVPELESQYGLTDAGHGQSWVLRVGTETTALSGLGTEMALPALVTAVGDAVAARLELKSADSTSEPEA